MLVLDGAKRMRFRNGTTQAQTAMMQPGLVYDCTITLPSTSITFLAGHKIRLDVSSSNYPRFNRNMNTGGVMYPGNSTDSLVSPVIANNTVYSSGTNASYITMPLIGYGSGVLAAQTIADGLQLYPNPAGDVLNIQWSSSGNNDFEWKVFDVTGTLVAQGRCSDKQDHTIDIEKLKPGMYLMQLGEGNVLQTKSFVKQ
jgi:hypothetical protein